MSDAAAVLRLALSPERATAERLRSLAELSPLLHDEPLVRELMEAARAEKSIEVRGAMLDALLAVNVTRLKDRAAYVDGLAYFAGYEPESALRARAISRLGAMAEGEAIVAETLRYDLDESVQAACLSALSSLARKSPPTIDALLAFGRTAPRGLRPTLVSLYAGLENEHAQAGLASLLHAWEDEHLQARVLDGLAKFPSLSPAASAAIGAYLEANPPEALEARALDIVCAKKEADLEYVLRRLERAPHLAARLRDRLASTPGLVDRLVAIVVRTPSSTLKLALMELLVDAQVPALFVALLRDANPWVREAAVDWCAKHVREHAEPVTAGLAAAIPAEPVRSLRHAMVRAFLDSGRKGPEVEHALVGWFEKETDPKIEASLVSVLPGVAITDKNRATILRAFRKALLEPFFGEDVKAIVTERCRSFAYRDEPELVACLRTLLERATEIENVEELHDQLRRLDPDLDAIVPTLLKLFYRFLHHYPREPLHAWLRDFKDAAARIEDVRAQIPYIVRLTGATWILEGADTTARKKSLLPAFMEAVRQDAFRGPQRLLEEAWESRTLRKSDLLAIFNKLLDWPGQDALLQHVIDIMKRAELVTPEIVDRCFETLLKQPKNYGTYEIQKFLERSGKQELGYREKVVSLFKQDGYTRYATINGDPKDVSQVPRTWHDWEWQNWRLRYSGWPVASLYFELEPRPEMRELLASPPDERVHATATVHYLVLYHWWQQGVDEEDDYRALARHMKITSGSKRLHPLFDRALCLFQRRWNEYVDKQKGRPVPDDLALAAADAYAELCRMHATYGKDGEDRPKPLRGLDVARLEKVWPLDRELFEEVAEECRIATGEDEKEAERLYREFAKAINEGRKDDAIGMLDALLGRYRPTAIVRSRRKQIESAREKLASMPKLATADEEKAARELARRAEFAETTKEALAMLEELFAKYGHTEYVEHEKGFLTAWRDKLRKAVGH